MERNKGITLIALVVTVVVLIIIAGISIATLTGKGGIINQAKEAKKSTEKAENDENKQITDILSEAKEGANYGDATGAQIVKGYKAYGSDGSEIIGTMRNNGQLNRTLKAGESYEIPEGYTSGGKIEAKDLKSQTEGTATAEDIKEGKVAYVNGERIEGTGSKAFYLYKNGDECTALSGGWTSKTYQGSPSFSKNNGYLDIQSPISSGSAGYFYINNQIDFSQYSRLVVKWSKTKWNSSAHFTIIAGEFNHHEGQPGVFSNSNNYCYTERSTQEKYAIVNQEIEENLEFAIKNLTGTGSMYFYVYCGELKIREVYLEK